MAERANLQVPKAVKRHLSQPARSNPWSARSLVKSNAEPPTSSSSLQPKFLATRLRAAPSLPSEFQNPTCIATHQNAIFERPKEIRCGPPTAIIGSPSVPVTRTTTIVNTVISLRTALLSNSAMNSTAINILRPRGLTATSTSLTSPSTQLAPVTASHRA